MVALVSRYDIRILPCSSKNAMQRVLGGEDRLCSSPYLPAIRHIYVRDTESISKRVGIPIKVLRLMFLLNHLRHIYAIEET